MPTVSNSTNAKKCIRTGKDHTEYRFYFLSPNGSIEVSNEEAVKIAATVKELRIAGVTVSEHLKEPLPEPEKLKEAEGESASTEVN